MLFLTFPRHRVHALHVSCCGGVSFPFSLSLLVRLFVSLETLLTHIPYCLELILFPGRFSVLLCIPLGNFLDPGDKTASGLLPPPRNH